MKKYDLTDCSILIPVYIDSHQRLEHLYFQIQYYSRFFINYKLIIVELGREKKIHFPLQKEIHIEFIESEEDFSTSKICNIGASLVKTPFFCKCDTDAVINPRAFFHAFEELKRNPFTSLVLPYNGISFTVRTPLREELLSSFDYQKLPFIGIEENFPRDFPDMELKSRDSVGLIHHFRTAVFKKLGGYNEEFIGWGYEDNEILARFAKLGHPKKMLNDYNAFHLDHPRTEGSHFHLLKNMHKLHLVENMTADLLTHYITTWSRFQSNSLDKLCFSPSRAKNCIN